MQEAQSQPAGDPEGVEGLDETASQGPPPIVVDGEEAYRTLGPQAPLFRPGPPEAQSAGVYGTPPVTLREEQRRVNRAQKLVRDLNPGPLAPKARIIPLDQQASSLCLPAGRLPCGLR
ncbi:hypothetical protein QQF64_002949 [Cirrhinus molitorella]|uniref:Uncharacterized protein n=1 Tax=Cirrhinus molitorella TaxID=172907 RepID=A0ABR3MIK5_9TELE